MASSGGAGGEEDMVGLLHQLEDLSVNPDVPGSLSTSAVSCPSLRRPEIQHVDVSDRPLVFFDLETTGLGVGCHITQLAAVKGDDTFSRYVLPRIPIDPMAQEVTGITCQGDTMCHHGKQVQCVSIRQALQDFTEFLGTEQSVLVGHNIKRFDCPRLLIPLKACALLERFRQAVHGFVDTLLLFRVFQPNLKSYKLGALHQHYLGREFDAHDARADAQALQDIVLAASVPPEVLSQHSFTLTNISDLHDYNKTKSRLLRAWTPLVEGKFIGRTTAERVAGSGLRLEEVKEVFQRDGKEGVKLLLQQRTEDGKPRDWRRELDGVCKFLGSHQQSPSRSPRMAKAQRSAAYDSSPRKTSPGTTSSSPRAGARSPRPGARSPRTVTSSAQKVTSSQRTVTFSPDTVTSSPRSEASCQSTTSPRSPCRVPISYPCRVSISSPCRVSVSSPCRGPVSSPCRVPVSSPCSVPNSPRTVSSSPHWIASSPPSVSRSPPSVPTSPRRVAHSPPSTVIFPRKTERTTAMCAALSSHQRN